jgi:outer membrane protein
MKNFLFAIIAFFAFASVQAQDTKTGFSKGDTFVEGTVKFITSDNVKTFNINPSVGYFLTKKFAAGVTLNSKSTETAGVKTSDSFGLGIFGRCYFLSVGNNFKTYSQLAVTSESDKITDTKSTDVTLGLGANYFITKNISLTLSVADLAKFSSTSVSGTTSNETSIGFTGVNNPFTTATFGLNYRF